MSGRVVERGVGHQAVGASLPKHAVAANARMTLHKNNNGSCFISNDVGSQQPGSPGYLPRRIIGVSYAAGHEARDTCEVFMLAECRTLAADAYRRPCEAKWVEVQNAGAHCKKVARLDVVKVIGGV